MHIRWQRYNLVDVALLLGIAVGAAVLRLAWVFRSETFPVEGMDMLFYDEIAQRLATGFGYSYQDGAESITTGVVPPGLHFAFSRCFKRFGPPSEERTV